MTAYKKDFILPDVPEINSGEHPDIFLETLSIAASYKDDALQSRFPMGVYAHLTGYTGRGWLIGFDDAGYYWDKYGVQNPNQAFAVSGLESNLEHHETLYEAVAYLGYAPNFLWNVDCRYKPDASLAAPLVDAAKPVNRSALRQYVVDYLTTRHRPLVCFLYYAPHISIVEAALLTGFESEGDVIIGVSPHLGTTPDKP